MRLSMISCNIHQEDDVIQNGRRDLAKFRGTWAASKFTNGNVPNAVMPTSLAGCTAMVAMTPLLYRGAEHRGQGLTTLARILQRIM